MADSAGPYELLCYFASFCDLAFLPPLDSFDLIEPIDSYLITFCSSLSFLAELFGMAAGAGAATACLTGDGAPGFSAALLSTFRLPGPADADGAALLAGALSAGFAAAFSFSYSLGWC